MATRQGTGAPSFCWHCRKPLREVVTKGSGIYYFQYVKDQLGLEHRVHDVCVKNAAVDGVKFVPL